MLSIENHGTTRVSSGNINEAMATGVEGAAVVCCFMTQKYERSKNCSAELNYANDRGSTVRVYLF